MPSRDLHEIEFFPDLIISKAEIIVISQVKEIARHGLSQRLPPHARSSVGKTTQAPPTAKPGNTRGWHSRSQPAT
jgi:hypothetical protein